MRCREGEGPEASGSSGASADTVLRNYINFAEIHTLYFIICFSFQLVNLNTQCSAIYIDLQSLTESVIPFLESKGLC